MSMQWSKEFETGVQNMDAQHHNLVNYLNQVSDLAEKAQTGILKDPEPIRVVLDELVEYTLTHFMEEEAYMAQIGYPDLEKHKALHQELVQQVGELMAEFENSGLVVVPKLGAFLTTWLKGHILGVDKKYGSYIQRV